MTSVFFVFVSFVSLLHFLFPFSICLPTVGRRFLLPDFYKTAADIPKALIKNNSWIKCLVVSVVDGDTIRCRHIPQSTTSSDAKAFYEDVKAGGKKVSRETISIRLYGVDAPELGRGSRVGQLFAEESTELVKGAVLGKVVDIKILAKDFYKRILGRVMYTETDVEKEAPERRGGGGKRKRGEGVTPMKYDISGELLKKGYAQLYKGGGASYDGKRAELKELERIAKEKGKGVWGLPDCAFQSPADYRKEGRQKKAKK